MSTRRDPPTPPIGRWGKVWRVVFVVGGGIGGWMVTMVPIVERASPGQQFLLVVVDPVLGIAAWVLVIWRRRWPARVAATVAIFGMVSATAGSAAVLALASVAARRRWRELVWLVPLNMAGALGTVVLWAPLESSGTPWLVTIAMVVLIIATIVAVGYAVGGRRELERERVETAERDQERRVAQAAADERTRIAREMHDVLAHRISLVAMHAGALTYRTDLTPAQQAQAAATIETNAHQALQDLREVLGVLREPRQHVGSAPEPPQPGIRDLSTLVAETEGLGTRITYADATQGEVPSATGRTAYRVVQEALTNARKHAPGTAVQVRLTGRAADGLEVDVRNQRARQPAAHDLPESGLGLVGLAERVSLAGGTLRHGAEADGGYRLQAWLPWPAPEPVASGPDGSKDRA